MFGAALRYPSIDVARSLPSRPVTLAFLGEVDDDFCGLRYEQMGVSTNGGTPIAGWFIKFISWKILSIIWMITGGTPFLGNLRMISIVILLDFP